MGSKDWCKDLPALGSGRDVGLPNITKELGSYQWTGSGLNSHPAIFSHEQSGIHGNNGHSTSKISSTPKNHWRIARINHQAMKMPNELRALNNHFHRCQDQGEPRPTGAAEPRFSALAGEGGVPKTSVVGWYPRVLLESVAEDTNR